MSRDYSAVASFVNIGYTGIMREPPVRLCCGKRHFGVVCPDGSVQCCVCLERFALDELSQVEDDFVNVCIACKAREDAEGA